MYPTMASLKAGNSVYVMMVLLVQGCNPQLSVLLTLKRDEPNNLNVPPKALLLQQWLGHLLFVHQLFS